MSKPVMCRDCKWLNESMYEDLHLCEKYGMHLLVTDENFLQGGKYYRCKRCVRENGGERKEARHEE